MYSHGYNLGIWGNFLKYLYPCFIPHVSGDDAHCFFLEEATKLELWGKNKHLTDQEN